MRLFFFFSLLLFHVFMACHKKEAGPKSAISAEQSVIRDTVMARQYLTQAERLIDAQKYDEALVWGQKADSIFSAVLGTENLPVADARHQCGRAWRLKKSDYGKAKAYFESSLKIRERLLGDTHPDVGKSLTALGIVYYYLDSFQTSLSYHQQALDIFQQSPETYRLPMADVCLDMGNVFMRKGESQLAIEVGQKSLKFAEGDSVKMGKAHGMLGNSFSNIKEFDRAIQHFEQALNLLSAKSPNAIVTYTNIGICYTGKGDSKQAIAYQELALAALQAQQKESPAYVNVYVNLASAYSEAGDYGRANEYYQNAVSYGLKLGLNINVFAKIYADMGITYYRHGKDSLARHYLEKGIGLLVSMTNDPDTKHDLALMYNHLGNVFVAEKNADKAIRAQEHSLKLLENLSALQGIDPKNLQSLDSDKADVYNNMGLSYDLKKDYTKALSYFERALKTQRNIFGEKHPNVAKPLVNMANCYRDFKKADKASIAYQDALNALGHKKGEPLGGMSHIPLLIEILDYAGHFHLLRYRETKVLEHLSSAGTYYREALRSLDHQFKTFSPATKPGLTAQAHSIYEGLLNVNYLFYKHSHDQKYLIEGFAFAERSKAFLLQEAMQESKALAFAGIPDSLLQQEYQLRVDLVFYEKRRQEMLSMSQNQMDPATLDVTKNITALTRRYEALKKQLETRYPRYYQAKYDLSVIDLDDVQQNLLKPGQALLEYFLGEDSIFIFAIRRDAFLVKTVKKDSLLKPWIKAIRDGLTLPYTPNSGTNERAGATMYATAAHALYKAVFQPVDTFLSGQRLIVVPDGELGYVPFDVLLATMPEDLSNWRGFPCLLNKHRISFAHSATLLRKASQKQHFHKPSQIFLGIAPAQDSSKANLRESMAEVEDIQALLGGHTLTGGQATKQAFSEAAGKCRILHLSTHANADDQVGDNCYIQFSKNGNGTEDGRFFNRDLYNLSLNADMVVLSACETGIGELQRGEGIISLSRGFFYAGAKSIVPSLWKVNSAASAELMDLFYKNLQKGMDKDEALHSAKQYLRDNSPYANAFYWAAFIPVGDMAPITSNGWHNAGWFWGLIGAALLFALIMVWRRRQKEA